MSENIQTIYGNAELALAAYANLIDNSPTTLQSNINSLKEAGFSAKQVEEFAERYPTIVTQYNDTDTSFSATVFKGAEGNLATKMDFHDMEQRKAA